MAIKHNFVEEMEEIIMYKLSAEKQALNGDGYDIYMKNMEWVSDHQIVGIKIKVEDKARRKNSWKNNII